MPTRLIQHHDEFAKHNLDEPGNADAFIRERLPAKVVERFSAEAAVDRSESHISPSLRDLRGDRVYSVRTVEGDEVLVWTMIEHKSAPDSDILRQLLADLAGIACKGATIRKTPGGRDMLVPAAVYAIVLYHSNKDWDFPTDLASAYGLPHELTRLGLLSFVYTLVNLMTIPDEALSTYAPLRAALMVLKYASYDDDPRVTLARLLEAAVTFGLTTLTVVVTYLVKESDWLDLNDIRPIVARLLPGQEEKVMSPAMRQIIDMERPRILAEERPKIVAEERPRILAEGRAAVLLRLLERKFGRLADDTAERVRAADDRELDRMLDAILDAESVEAVLATARR